MPSSDVAAQAFGTLGAIFWSIQLLPQIWMNYKRGHTHGLQPMMMLLWAAAGIPLGVYNIVRSFPIALQIQPQILTLLSLITWAQTQYYPPARNVWTRSKSWCIMIGAIACISCAGIETAFVFGLRKAVDGRNQQEIEHHPAIMTMGVLAALLLCSGVAAHYVDIWRESTVRGISFLFVGLDALGDLTSLISVTLWWKAGQSLDILGLVVYGSEFILWSGIMMCGIWFNLWPRLHKVSGPLQTDQIEPNLSTIPADVPRPSTDSQVSGSAFRTASRDDSNAGQEQMNIAELHELRRRHGHSA